MVFLDLKKKVWIIKDLEVPVIEDIPMKELNVFKDDLIKAEELSKKGKTGTKEEVEFENNWYERTCQLGLGKSRQDIEDTNISLPDFRALMAEVYAFLSVCGTIEGAKQSGLYEVETPSKGK